LVEVYKFRVDRAQEDAEGDVKYALGRIRGGFHSRQRRWCEKGKKKQKGDVSKETRGPSFASAFWQLQCTRTVTVIL